MNGSEKTNPPLYPNYVVSYEGRQKYGSSSGKLHFKRFRFAERRADTYTRRGKKKYAYRIWRKDPPKSGGNSDKKSKKPKPPYILDGPDLIKSGSFRSPGGLDWRKSSTAVMLDGPVGSVPDRLPDRLRALVSERSGGRFQIS